MAVKIRFECSKEDRFSKVYGPFDFAQLTEEDLRVGPGGEDIASCAGGQWWPEAEPGVSYSDIIISSVDTGQGLGY